MNTPTKQEIFKACIYALDGLEISYDAQIALGLPDVDKYGDRYYPTNIELRVAAIKWLAENIQFKP